MSPEILSAAAGVVISLLFKFVPRLNKWFAVKEKETQQSIMLGILFLVALAAFGLACANILNDLFGVALTCDKSGGIVLARSLILAVVTNQSVYAITPAPKAVRLAKASRPTNKIHVSRKT